MEKIMIWNQSILWFPNFAAEFSITRFSSLSDRLELSGSQAHGFTVTPMDIHQLDNIFGFRYSCMTVLDK